MSKAQFVVRAVDGTKAAFNSVKSGFSRLSGVAQKTGAAISAVAAKARIAVLALAGAAAASVREFVRFEAAARPFARFTGGIEQATAHLKELQQIGRTGVIPTDELIEASRSLMQFSDGVLGGAADMKALADVAATTGNNVGNVAGGVRRFMQAVAQGRNVQSASRDLERMGVVSVEARQKLRELQDQGGGTEAMFAVLSAEINKFAGGVESDMDTGAAAFRRIKETGKAAMVEIGQSIMTEAMPAFNGLSDTMQDALDAGIVQEYVDQVIEAFSLLKDALEPIFDWLAKGFQSITGGVQDGLARISGFIGAVQSQGVDMRSLAKATAQIGTFNFLGAAKTLRRDFGDAWDISGDVMRQERDERTARAEDRALRRAEARSARQRGETTTASGAFAAGADAGRLTALLADDDDGGGKRGMSGASQRVFDRLREMGHKVEEYVPGGSMFAGQAASAREQLQKDESMQLMRRSADTQEQIRDLLRRNLEAS